MVVKCLEVQGNRINLWRVTDSRFHNYSDFNQMSQCIMLSNIIMTGFILYDL